MNGEYAIKQTIERTAHYGAMRFISVQHVLLDDTYFELLMRSLRERYLDVRREYGNCNGAI